MANTFAGAKIAIGSTAAAVTQTDFESDSYVNIDSVSNMGEIGAAANVLTFPIVTDDFVQKSKGTRNAGDPVLVVGRDSSDPGQIALRAAEKTRFFYNFRLELQDAENELMTNTVMYFRALVVGVTNQLGGVEDFVTESYTLGIYPGPLIIESAAI